MSTALIFDIAAGCVLAFFLVRGLIKGFSGEIIGLVGLFVSTFCAWNFLDPAVDLVFKYFSHPVLDRTIVSLICAVAIFIIVSLIFAVIGIILSFIVKAANLSLIDHMFGLVTGALKTGCLILFLYGLLSTFSPVLPSEWMKESYVMKGASFVWPYARDFLQEHEILDFRKLTGGK